jgi:integrase
MKTALSQTFVLKLDINHRPMSEKNKHIVYENNLNHVEYSVTDDHRDAPIGFSVKVTASSKTYQIQRKINGKLLKRKVGNVRDFQTIDAARLRAYEILKELTGQLADPLGAQAKKSAEELTLGKTFDLYVNYLTNRASPAKENTLKTIAKARVKLSEWELTQVRHLTAEMILSRFDAIANKTRTTAEQSFRLASAAIDYAIQLERHNANSHSRTPFITFNPFSILKLTKKFRTTAQLESDYLKSGVRNPMSPDTQMFAWLNAIWGRRKNNRTGCDYLLATTIWGNRKVEATKLKWRSRISETESRTTSWIDLEKRIVFFYETKNGRNHTLPLSDCMLELFKQRFEITAEAYEPHRIYVFPSEFRTSKIGHVAKGHYSDMRALMNSVKKDAGIELLGIHDLRRTLGRIVEDLGLPYAATKRLLNHSSSDVTLKYTDPEWSRLTDYMQRVEDKILMYAPIVYNALKPASKPAIMVIANINSTLNTPN